MFRNTWYNDWFTGKRKKRVLHVHPANDQKWTRHWMEVHLNSRSPWFCRRHFPVIINLDDPREKTSWKRMLEKLEFHWMPKIEMQRNESEREKTQAMEVECRRSRLLRMSWRYCYSKWNRHLTPGRLRLANTQTTLQSNTSHTHRQKD